MSSWEWSFVTDQEGDCSFIARRSHKYVAVIAPRDEPTARLCSEQQRIGVAIRINEVFASVHAAKLLEGDRAIN